jgi:hypothetical protein
MVNGQSNETQSAHFWENHVEKVILGSGFVLVAGGIGAIALGVAPHEESPEHKLSERCQETSYEDMSVDLPDKLIVRKDGTVTDGNGEPFRPTEGLHFSGLSSLNEHRRDIAETTTLAELQTEADEAFAPLGLEVMFTAGSDFPEPIENYYPDEKIEKLLPEQRNLGFTRREVDQLLIDETFRPDEFREIGGRKSVTLLWEWGYAGQAFESPEHGNNETYSVRLIGFGRKVSSGMNAHEAGHNFDSGVCQYNYGNDAISALKDKDTAYNIEEVPYDRNKNGVVKYDKERFISEYSATDGYIEEWAEASQVLYTTGYPKPQNPEDPTIVDQKFAAVAQIHDLYAPGSLEYFLALGTRKLCFDIALDDKLYEKDKIPQQRYTCSNVSQ